MSSIKKLASDTAIYGLSNMVGRLLNYLLVPLYARIFAPQDYAIVTELYAYVAFLNIIYLYGMETAYFRFINKKNAQNVYKTTFITLLVSSVCLSGLLMLFSAPLAAYLGCKPQYIVWFACIMGFDAIAAMPFCRLRQTNQPAAFARLKLLNIGINVFFNVWLLTDILPRWFAVASTVDYIFLINLVANATTLLLLVRYMPLGTTEFFDQKLLKQMIAYATPLLLVGLLGMLNDMFSRAAYKHILHLPAAEVARQLGIFGAAYKISVLMTLFTQTFRMGAEPFFFNKAQDANAPETYAKIMRWFVAIGCIFFVVVTVFLQNKGCCQTYSIAGIIIGSRHPEYYEGMRVVPILFMANLLAGVYYNLSVWYRLRDKTTIGAYLAAVGAAVTIVGNLYAIPRWGYVGAAWVGFFSFLIMTIGSYLLGQKYYAVPYGVGRIVLYILSAVGVYMLQEFILLEAIVTVPSWLYAIKISSVMLYIASIYAAERKQIKHFLMG